MKKFIYGILDSRTNLLGDLCLLDRDEEFKAGCLNLFRMPSIPDYLVLDLQAYCFGSVSFGDDDLPNFHIFPVPKLILCGSSTEVISLRKEINSDDNTEEDS